MGTLELWTGTNQSSGKSNEIQPDQISCRYVSF